MKKVHSLEKGQIVVLLALALIALLAFTALAIDGGMIYADRRYMQSVADAASIAGAGKIASAFDSEGITTGQIDCTNPIIGTGVVEATNKANEHGFVDNGPTEIVDVNVDNCTTSYVDVEVTLTHETSTSFVHILTGQPMINTVNSITTAKPGEPLGSGSAIVALRTGPCHPSDVGVTISGTSDVFLINGGIWSNSCLTFNGTANVHVQDLEGKILTNSIVYNDTDVPYHAQSESLVVEPLPINTGDTQETVSGFENEIHCDDENDIYDNIGQHNNNNRELPPGNYHDIIMTQGSIILTGGLYCIDGTVNLNGGTFRILDPTESEPPNGVTLYFTGDSFTINGGVHVDLAAPNEKPEVTFNNPGNAIEDMLIYVPESSDAVIKLNGNAGSTISGTIYAPGSLIEVGGNTTLDTGETFTLSGSLIGYDVHVVGVSGIDIRYDPNNPVITPPSITVTK